MRIGILSQNGALYSTRRLVEAAKSRGHEAVVIETTAVAVEIGTVLPDNAPIKLVRTTPMLTATFQRTAVAYLPPVDAIVPRIGASITEYGVAVVRQFESQGVATSASSVGIACSRDKLHSLQIMHDAGLATPKTAVISRSRALPAAVAAVGGAPVIIKLVQGTQGQGVIFARNLATAAAVVDKLRSLRQQLLVQEYIEADGRDLRILVIGGEVVAAMERQASSGDFRANLHRGGTAVSVDLDAETKALAVAAAAAHNLHTAGVDIIQSDHGPLLLEVNSSPGLEGIEQSTQVDVAGAIIAFLVNGGGRPSQL